MTSIELIETPDGRRLEVLVAGDETAPVLLFHSGSPSAAVSYPPLEEAAERAGLRMVTYSRPGYGDSTPRTGDHTVADDVADVVTILEHVGVIDFVTLGWSGGGPRALACAALLPDRCRAAASLAGVAPYDAEGLDWLDGMAEENVAEYTAAAQGIDAYGAYLEREALPMMNASAEELAEGMGGLLTPVDRAALDPSYSAYLAEEFHRAAAQGVVGMRDDGLVATRPWGFDLASITVPVAIWQGDQDAMVPYAHGRWLAANVPGARRHLLPGEGHLSVVAMIDDILAELVEMSRSAGA